jgi:hypothetical protein
LNYTKQYFGKELGELTYQDIENFFVEEKDESDKIEFKSYHNAEERNHTEKENGVIRAICGLLNSEGGIVIWGAPIGQTVVGKNEKIFKGALSPSDKIVEKDSFISRVTDLITPSPKGIKFQSIEKEGKYIYIIEVEQSFYSPHQFRNVYYMRIDGQTKPAPHHFIEALFRKVTFPKLEGYIKIDSIRSNGKQLILQISNMIFNKSKLQNEDEIYYRVLVTVGKFAQYGIYDGNDRIYTMEGHELRVYNAKATLYYNEPLTNSEYVLFDPFELTEENNECQIFLYFGGKKSPLMISQYKLAMGNMNATRPNSNFISIEENVYAYEQSDKLGKTDAERMKILLDR